MKSKLTVALATLAISFHPTTDPLPIGSPLPQADLKLKDVSGKVISLADVKTASGLLVMFSCNTCPYVIKNQDRTREIGAFAASKKIGFVVLNSNEGSRRNADSYEEMKKYANTQKYEWSYAVDHDNVLADAFGATRTPECFLFDGNGKLVYHGAIDDSPADVGKVQRNHLKLAINEMLDDSDVSVKESRSVGCMIKRKN